MQILSTKLHIPPFRDTLIHRPKLIDRLNAGLHRKLTLVSAPAGFGKTTVISNWVVQTESPVAWLSLDARDNDPMRFLTYLIAAIQTIDKDIADWVSDALQSAQQPALESVLTSLVNDIAVITTDFYLVLDDYHLIESPEIDAGLTFLLDHLPIQMHLIIITREDPQLPLSRLRVRDQLTELRIIDLRFTSDEATEFINQGMGLALSVNDIDALAKRTEGWVAGLQLAALSLQGRTDVTEFIQAFTGSHRFVVDYLLEEVLHQQPAPIREFLLHTSILDQLNGSLCDAVTERDDSQKILETLERNNLFVIPLDEERGWYRYHHLFGDALRNTIKSDASDIFPILHQRASHWHLERGQVQEAIQHALLADDLKQAADLIETIWPKMDDNYQSSPWYEWAKQLPESIVLNRPILCLGYGWYRLMRGEFELSEIWFQRAERWLHTETDDDQEMVVIDNNQFTELAASIHNARGYRALALGDIQMALQQVQLAHHLNQNRNHPNYVRSMTLSGLAYIANGELMKADQSLSQYTTYMENAAQIMDATELVFIIGNIRITLGRLHDAYAAYRNAFQFLAHHGNPSVIGLEDLYRGIADVYIMWNQLTLAEDNIIIAKEIAERSITRPNWLPRINETEAQLKVAYGDFDEALNLLDEAEQHFVPTPVTLERPIHAFKARIWIRQGKLDAAQQWIRQYDLTAEDDITFLREYEYLTLARLYIASYKKNPSGRVLKYIHSLLDQLYRSTTEGTRIGYCIEVLILKALIYDTQHETNLSLDNLQQALSLAEPEGLIRPFIDEGEPMKTLLSKLRGYPHLSEFVTRINTAQSQPDTTPTTTQPLIDPLSDREMDVLRLLKTELTGPEIADELMISLSTMRTHTRNIYSKLEANNRRIAVRKAVELSLI